MNKLIFVILICFIHIGFVDAQQWQSQSQSQGHNHFDPHNRAYERMQKGKHWHKQWLKHYGHKKSRKQWHEGKRKDGLQPYTSAIDYSTRNVYIFNYENDELITISQDEIHGWPGSLPLQHTAINAKGDRMWISTDATVNDPPRVFMLGVSNVNWNNNTARLRVLSNIAVGGVGEPSTLPAVESVSGSSQEVALWIQPSMAQVHGNTFLPFSEFMYMTEYTGDKVHVFKNLKNRMKLVDTIQIPGWTDQTHGIMFNTGGSVGLGTGYFYDNHIIDVYKPNRKTGELTTVGQIPLEIITESGEKWVAPMTHLIDWIDTRYAVVATMQHDRTSLTPNDVDGFIGPSVWLIDSVDLTATKIIDQAMNVGGAGVFRSASDVAVVNGKLYIAEEDSVRQVDVSDARDGYVSVFDLTDLLNPVFLKRLAPGTDFPQGFDIAHTFSKTPDGRFIMLGSWHSGYVIKIDTYDDTVSHVWGAEDGLVMPHGLMNSGSLR